MKTEQIIYEKGRVTVKKNLPKHILAWGEDNDYPQSVIDIVNSSYTGVNCLDRYRKFIYGRGFADKDNYQIVVNSDGDTADTLLQLCADDLASFGGFAVHVNRNLLGQITSMRHIPLENVRLCPDDKNDPEYAGKVALHPDWGERSWRKFKEIPIEYFWLYDPDVQVFRERIALEENGILDYKGEIFIYSNKRGSYPLPIYDSVLTDMSTQEGVSNVTYRNVRRGFMPAGCFAEINPNYDDNNEEDKKQFDETGEVLRSLQGDKQAASIMHVTVKDKDSLPQFIAMKGENYDKEFTVSTDSVRKAIGQCFSQPPELRCEDTSKGFANDTMIQAYRVYNSMTSNERQVLEQEFARLFKQWHQPLDYNFQIQPLSYGEETLLSLLGADTAKAVVELATNATVAVEQRKQILMIVYGLPEDMANNILMLHADQD